MLLLGTLGDSYGRFINGGQLVLCSDDNVLDCGRSLMWTL